MNPSNYGDSRFPLWQLSGFRSGNLLSDSGRKERRGMPGRYSNMWSVRGNHNCPSTSKFQPFPSIHDEENEISTSIHHGNDNIQSGFFGHRGPVYHEAPKGTAYPSYKDVLLSSRQVTDRKLTSSTSSRKDSSRNMAPGRSKRKRPRRKKRPRKQNVQSNYQTQAERQQTLLLLYAMDDEEDIDAGDEDIADNREFGRSISKYIKAAGPPADQGDSIDSVPRLASVPDQDSVGFVRGWTNRESKHTTGGKKTSVQQESTARAVDSTPHLGVRTSSASLRDSGRTAPDQQPSSSAGQLPTIEEAPSGLSLPIEVLHLEPRSTSASWGLFDQGTSQQSDLFGLRGLVYNEPPDLSVLPPPTKGFFGFRGLVYNEAPKISVLFKPTTDDFRFRRLTYGELLNAKRSPL
mmetsp:Transcript_33858/g.76316  ORF Transcript_33858/g.76316 Transcript_33858/m.76316 type:complete len:405 (+) Transcript_33858:186-1400(+)